MNTKDLIIINTVNEPATGLSVGSANSQVIFHDLLDTLSPNNCHAMHLYSTDLELIASAGVSEDGSLSYYDGFTTVVHKTMKELQGWLDTEKSFTLTTV